MNHCWNAYSCGAFGQIRAELCRPSCQHHPAIERMGDDLDGSGRQLLLLLLTGQLHHFLHETNAVLSRHRADGLRVCVFKKSRRENRKREMVSFSG